jgi:hypothetical protein
MLDRDFQAGLGEVLLALGGDFELDTREQRKRKKWPGVSALKMKGANTRTLFRLS